MIAVVELLQQNGIKLPNTAPGRHYTTCPQCSTGRSLAHQRLEVLGVTIDGDKVSWGCNHCGWTGPEKGSGVPRGNGGDLTAHVYRDGEGVARFRKVRNLPGRQPRFWLQQPDGGGGWKKGTKGVDTSIIYRADEVRRAVADGREIAIVEGEKDSDRLWSIGIPATCNAHGASELGKKPKWTKAHSAQLKGADLVVFNDNDPAGYEHADAACRLSTGVAKRVRRLDLAPHWPGIPKGGDVSDWLAAGADHTPERLLELIEAAPDYAPADRSSPATGGASASETPADDDAELTRLAKLTMFDYERTRAEAAKRLGVRAAMLDRVVAAKRAELGLNADAGRQGRAINLPEAEPWPEPVDGPALLDNVISVISNFVIMTGHAAVTAAVWCLHTYMVERFLVSPRLAIRSPTKGCGKTTLLDILARLVHRPLPTTNVTAAAVFRVVEGHRPCLLVDEGDTFLRDNDELRGILNSGHRQGGSVLRVEGDTHEPRAFSTFSPCAIAVIGQLPDTLTDRSVAIDLKRRLPDERIEPFRLDRTTDLAQIARKLARWVKDHGEAVGGRDPEMPPGLHNRAADNWRPLLAIADAIGGKWPERARAAAVSGMTLEPSDVALIEMLLGDIRDVFDGQSGDRLSSEAIIRGLVEIMPRPWGEYGKGGKPITPNKLARLLKPLGIPPQILRFGDDERARGYQRQQFDEAFERYLGIQGFSKCDSVTNAVNPGTSGPSQTVTAEKPVTDGKSEKSNNDGLCHTVTVGKAGAGEKAHARTPKPKSDEMPYDGPVVPVPDQGPDPLGAHGEPVTATRCAHCGRPGGNRVGLGDGTDLHLHRDCEMPFIDRRTREEGAA